MNAIPDELWPKRFYPSIGFFMTSWIFRAEPTVRRRKRGMAWKCAFKSVRVRVRVCVYTCVRIRKWVCV